MSFFQCRFLRNDTAGRGQGAEGRVQGARGKGQGARGKGQGARGRGQGVGNTVNPIGVVFSVSFFEKRHRG